MAEKGKASPRDELTREQLEAVLKHFGFDDFPSIDLIGLEAVYRAWCRNVPFDNVQKRVYFARGEDGLLPGIFPVEFFDNLLEHGTGGTCWTTTGAFYSLLMALGFDVARVTGDMLDIGEFDRPTHGSTVVSIDGNKYCVDTSILSEEPIPLLEGETASTTTPLLETTSEPVEDTWKIWWMPGHSRDRMAMQFTGPGAAPVVDLDYFIHRSEVSRSSSLFNQAVYIRKNMDGCVRTIGRGKYVKLDLPGVLTVEELDDDQFRTVLIDTFGLSEEIVEVLPPDNTESEESFG